MFHSNRSKNRLTARADYIPGLSLRDIARKARRRNALKNISGCLTCAHGLWSSLVFSCLARRDHRLLLKCVSRKRQSSLKKSYVALLHFNKRSELPRLSTNHYGFHSRLPHQALIFKASTCSAKKDIFFLFFEKKIPKISRRNFRMGRMSSI